MKFFANNKPIAFVGWWDTYNMAKAEYDKLCETQLLFIDDDTYWAGHKALAELIKLKKTNPLADDI